MDTDYLTLGPTPAEESCAQVGSDDYHKNARNECKRYVAQLIKQFGDPPEGAWFSTKNFPHDFGSYLEVVINYRVDDEKAREYAFNVEANLPSAWEEVA